MHGFTSLDPRPLFLEERPGIEASETRQAKKKKIDEYHYKTTTRVTAHHKKSL